MTKRKRKYDDSKPGKQHQVLQLYSALPTDTQGLKNGHILYQDKVHSSKADVLRFFKDNLSIVIKNNILQSLLTRSVKKYKNVAREAEYRKFREICEEAFTGYNVSDSVAVSVLLSFSAKCMSRSLDLETCSSGEGTSGTPPVTPLPSAPKKTTPVSASSSIRSLKRKGLLTPLMKEILERGEETKKDVRTLKNKVIVLRARLSSKKFKQNRYLQRQVAMLYERLRIKTEKLEKTEKELSEIKKEAVEEHVQNELVNAKRTIKRLKQQHKGCPSNVKFHKIMEENKDLKRKLKEKENAELLI